MGTGAHRQVGVTEWNTREEKKLLPFLAMSEILASDPFLSLHRKEELHCAANTNLVVSWFPGLMILWHRIRLTKLMT